MIHSYPSVYQIGHSAITNLFDGEVVVQEKVDGSQISFGLVDGELQVRSKGKQQLIDAPDKMFGKAIEVIKSLDLIGGLVYRMGSKGTLNQQDRPRPRDRQYGNGLRCDSCNHKCRRQDCFTKRRSN